MGRTKQKKLDRVGTFENVFDYSAGATETELKNFFQNENPITLEIGCGEGDYTVSLAEL